MRIYNTLTRKVEEFIPINKDLVTSDARIDVVYSPVDFIEEKIDIEISDTDSGLIELDIENKNLLILLLWFQRKNIYNG